MSQTAGSRAGKKRTAAHVNTVADAAAATGLVTVDAIAGGAGAAACLLYTSDAADE